MIQELLGGNSSSTLLGDTKISINGGLPHHHHVFHTSNPSCPPSTISSTATATATATTTSSTNPPSPASQNVNNNNIKSTSNNSLRCPRCDSANTKFCYYNNYNLTQPRHFCKTCRRYWTKGGALRNVPIGGGCRKNKNSIVTTTSKSSSGKFLKTISTEMITGRACYELPPNPILWGPCSSSPSPSSSSSPQSSHLLALLRAASQNPNPNPNSELTHHMISNGARATSMDNLVHQDPSLGLSNGSMWRSNTEQQHNGSVINLGVDNVHNSGMQELYQRLIRSSTTSNYFSDHPHLHSQPLMLSSAGSFSSPSASTILDQSAPQAVGGGSELGYGWNSSFAWSDLSTTNGAYP